MEPFVHKRIDKQIRANLAMDTARPVIEADYIWTADTTSDEDKLDV